MLRPRRSSPARGRQVMPSVGLMCRSAPPAGSRFVAPARPKTISSSGPPAVPPVLTRQRDPSCGIASPAAARR